MFEQRTLVSEGELFIIFNANLCVSYECAIRILLIFENVNKQRKSCIFIPKIEFVFIPVNKIKLILS